MSEDTVRIVIYEPVSPVSQSGNSDGRKSTDMVIPVPAFSTPEQSQDSSPPTDEVIGEFKIQEVSIEVLKASMNQLMEVVKQLMTQMECQTETSNIKLDEVELSVVVNGQGKFSLWGTGVSAGSTGGIKLKFKRHDLRVDG